MNKAITCCLFADTLQYRLTLSCYCLPRGTNWLFWFFQLSADAGSFFLFSVYYILTIQTVYIIHGGYMLKIFCLVAVILVSGCAGVGIGASGGSEGASVGIGIGTGIGF
ncbi:hypothetical protein CKG00_02935 [Morganella morganii]|uniref:Uncharacterized protein n=1 Tax=Morganella morganii TaxID=582 RepID=A0A433ZTL7_MORMO|nr:hypothetical protein CKG00_02935 [Morganella morganii]